MEDTSGESITQCRACTKPSDVDTTTNTTQPMGGQKGGIDSPGGTQIEGG